MNEPTITKAEYDACLANPGAEFVDGREPKTGRPVGVWFENQECWMYRGKLPVVIQFGKTTPEHVTEPMKISRCPTCERTVLAREYPGRMVRRWMIVPP